MSFNANQRANTIKTYLQRDWTTPSTIINYESTLNSEHNCKDLCIQLRNEQTCTFNYHDEIKGGRIFDPISANFCFNMDLIM